MFIAKAPAIVSGMINRPQGMFECVDPDPHKGAGQQAVQRMATSTCGHCGKVSFIKTGDVPTHCFGPCNSDICDRPECNDGCDVLENKLQRMENGERFRRDLTG